MCLEEGAPEGCNEAYSKNWPGVNLALYGPENKNATVYDLCLLSGSCVGKTRIPNDYVSQWGAFYLFIADFFATEIIGGTKELVVLL